MLSRLIISVPTLGFTYPALAQSSNYDVRPQANRLMAEDIRLNFSGVTQSGAYNFDAQGVPGNRFTEWHSEAGGILYREGDFTAHGRWSVARDALCYDYDSETITGGCFRIYKIGSCFYFYSTRRVSTKDEIMRDYWTARSVPKGQKATCEDLFS